MVGDLILRKFTLVWIQKFLHNIEQPRVIHKQHYQKDHYEKKLTKNIRPTDILQIYTTVNEFMVTLGVW